MVLRVGAPPRSALRGLAWAAGPNTCCGVRPLLAAAPWSSSSNSSTTAHLSSSSRAVSTVSLVYDLHEPAKPVSEDPNRQSPILFMHGLFGSKKNNRSISRYGGLLDKFSFFPPLVGVVVVVMVVAPTLSL